MTIALTFELKSDKVNANIFNMTFAYKQTAPFSNHILITAVFYFVKMSKKRQKKEADRFQKN